MLKYLVSFLFLSILILFISCGKSNEKQPDDEQKSESEEKTGIKSLDEFADNVKEFQKNMEEGKKYEVVDFRELKSLLPESIGDLKRTNAEGEKNSAMGFTVSQAKADYSSEDGSKYIDIEITDFGGTTGWAGLASWGWTMAEVDRETETGYEKTTTFKGHKAFERYDNQYQNGNIEVLVAGRFMVSVDGSNISMDIIKNALDEIDFSKLEGMKDFGEISE